MNRREALKIAGGGSLALVFTGLAGCNDQATIAALLSEMETAFTSIETELGKTLPASVVAAFNAAVAAVKSWVPGTAAQDVIQVLQDLSAAVGALAGLTPITALETAAIQIILGTIVNIIELIDPSAVPPVVGQAQLKLAHNAQVSVPQKHFKRGEIPANMLKKQFEAEWLAATGKKAA